MRVWWVYWWLPQISLLIKSVKYSPLEFWLDQFCLYRLTRRLSMLLYTSLFTYIFVQKIRKNTFCDLLAERFTYLFVESYSTSLVGFSYRNLLTVTQEAGDLTHRIIGCSLWLSLSIYIKGCELAILTALSSHPKPCSVLLSPCY